MNTENLKSFLSDGLLLLLFLITTALSMVKNMYLYAITQKLIYSAFKSYDHTLHVGRTRI